MGTGALTVIGEMLAGLALFFVGIKHLKSCLRQITCRKFRMLSGEQALADDERLDLINLTNAWKSPDGSIFSTWTS
jgi:hypothetical protein